jgi:hypothetical protein
MKRKLTVVVDPSKINKFVKGAARPGLESAYAQMARNKKREKEAMDWAEASFQDIIRAKR